MYKKIILTKILVTLFFLTFNAQATFIDGNTLMGYVKEEQRTGRSSEIFIGYIAGVHDSFNNFLICTPPNVTLGQLKAIVIKFMNENPEEWAKSGDYIVSVALAETFSCKK